MNRSDVLSTIDDCIKLISRKEGLVVNETTALFANNGILDSISLVSFLMELEQQLSEKHGVSVRLISDKALSLKVSPFSSVASLTDFIMESQHGQS